MIARSRVVLPAPLAPTTATASPCATPRSTSFSTLRPRYPADTPATRSSAPSPGNLVLLRSLPRGMAGRERVPGEGILTCPEVGVDHRGLSEHPLRTALGQRASVVEDLGAGGDGADGGEDVLDRHHRAAVLGEGPDHLLDPLGLGGGHPRHGLVEQQHPGTE